MAARLTLPALAALASLASLASPGCRPAATPSIAGETSGSKTWSMPSDGKGTLGLDGGSVYFIGSRFVVWAADGRGGGGGTTHGGRDRTTGDGYILLEGGRKVSFAFDMPGDRLGTAQINGTDYDLAKGRLFLVKPRDDRLEVLQLDTDLSGVNVGRADLAAFGRADPAIRAFFEAGR